MRGVERGDSRDRLLNVMRHRRGCFSRHRVRPETLGGWEREHPRMFWSKNLRRFSI
jgi:hypothetical protein